MKRFTLKVRDYTVIDEQAALRRRTLAPEALGSEAPLARNNLKAILPWGYRGRAAEKSVRL
jgi:hypothetical protein